MSRNELHDLLYSNPNVGVEEVQALIGKYPNAVKEKDSKENLPLHTAATFGASVEVVQLLIKKYPDAVKEKNEGGWLPLHHAVYQGARLKVVQLLIKEYPDAMKEKNGYGDLPLHHAVQNEAPKEVFQLLIKEYPDAVKEKDYEGNLPLDLPKIKEIYDRVITVVQNLVRGQGLLGDHAKGKDLLGVKEEAQAIAETIAFKDLQPPFVVGILGGWGSGKSFTFNLIEERLKEIQEYDLATDAVKLHFPYVGHIYLIKFDVWTFSKLCLWSSLMNRILTELNDQLDLEVAIGTDLLMEGVSVIELMKQFTTSGEIKYLKESMKGKSAKKEIRDWKQRGGNGSITEALINATNSNYEKEVEELKEKKQKLHRFLALEEVTAEKNTKIQPEIKQLLKDAYKNYAKENRDDQIPRTVDDAMNSFKRCRGIFGRLKIYCCLLRAGRLSPLWFAVFLSSLLVALLIPLFLYNNKAIAAAIGPVVSGIYAVYNNATEKLRTAKAEIDKVASEMHFDKEQVRKALKAADGAQLRRDNDDEENQQKAIQKLNTEINSLDDRIWLRKGDSLNKVVEDRLGSSNYEEHLGVVHQAQKDLQHLSDALLRRDDNEEVDAKKIFPRGDPRIVLFIDDLDRCPPKKVVETLEAVQLLVKTKLFVVVLAIDAQYVTLCLEDQYQNILHPERHPSGLDYIEKIIQLPYRVPPISADYMKSYLQEQMNAKKTISSPLSSDNATDKATSDEEMPMMKTAQSEPHEPSPGAEESKSDDDIQSSSDNATDETTNDVDVTSTSKPAQSEVKAIPLPTENLDFTWDELELQEDACVISGVSPRATKRLVNVFKLLKIIWYHRDQTPGVDTLHGVSMKKASVLILALCASSFKSVRREMCKVFARIEKTTTMPACGNLKDFIRKALGEIGSEQVDDSPLTMIYDEKCNVMFEQVKWEKDEEWKLVKNDLRLLRCFSFVGEYNELGSTTNHRRALT